jgi:hypothetical protein
VTKIVSEGESCGSNWSRKPSQQRNPSGQLMLAQTFEGKAGPVFPRFSALQKGIAL